MMLLLIIVLVWKDITIQMDLFSNANFVVILV